MKSALVVALTELIKMRAVNTVKLSVKNQLSMISYLLK